MRKQKLNPVTDRENYLSTSVTSVTSESTLQARCFQHAWNYYPQSRKLLCYNLNNSKNKVDGARNKAMGLIAGRSDMVLYWKGKAHMLEFKQPGEKQSKAQLEWQRIVIGQGFSYTIIASFDEFIETLDSILKYT